MDLTDVTPDADAFRALARSSPWRWRTLHLTHSTEQRTVEAWVTRPGHLRVVGPRGEQVETGLPYTNSTWDPQGRSVPVVPRLPHTVTPTYRPDRLVAARPEASYDDPMFENFQWVAMLDPVELSTGVGVDDVTRSLRHGRVTWVATLRAGAGYDARCADCCDLLVDPSHRVGLDLQTGIVVDLEGAFSVQVHAAG